MGRTTFLATLAALAPGSASAATVPTVTLIEPIDTATVSHRAPVRLTARVTGATGATFVIWSEVITDGIQDGNESLVAAVVGSPAADDPTLYVASVDGRTLPADEDLAWRADPTGAAVAAAAVRGRIMTATDPLGPVTMRRAKGRRGFVGKRRAKLAVTIRTAYGDGHGVVVARRRGRVVARRGFAFDGERTISVSLPITCGGDRRVRLSIRARGVVGPERAVSRVLRAPGCDRPKPKPAPVQPLRPACDPSYPTVCIPPPPPDLDCGDISFRNFAVRGSDPHGFDREGDGVGCES